MKVLVTGGAGFIGSHLVERLIQEGKSVRVLDSLDTQIHQSFQRVEGVEFAKGTVKSRQDWMKALQGVDAVYHLAAAVGISQSMHKPVHFMETNTIGTANLYDILLNEPEIRKSIRRIIVPSSKTIYGEGTYECKDCGIVYPPVRKKEQLEKGEWEMKCPGCGSSLNPVGTKEDKPVNPISVYALSKYDTEILALNFAHALDIPTLVFRGFSVYGPGQSLSNPYSGVCSIFLSRIKNNQPPVVFEDGEQLRDYIFIDDVVNFLAKMLEHKAEGVYNLGTGNPTSVNEIVSILIDETGSGVQPNITGDFRVGDNRHDFADMGKALKDTGFSPKTGIKKGLKALVEWGEKSQAVDHFDESERIRKGYFQRAEWI
jgi:dTDP-L-rhamnose 4-epimerase